MGYHSNYKAKCTVVFLTARVRRVNQNASGAIDLLSFKRSVIAMEMKDAFFKRFWKKKHT